MSASEMSHNISKITTHVEKQGKRGSEIGRAADYSTSAISDDDEDINVLGYSNK